MPCPRVAFEARVVDDPDLRFGQAGAAIGKVRLVAGDRRKNPTTDEWEDGDQLWINATAFKQLAENMCESIVKGDLVIVAGKIRTENWETREGEKRSAVAMVLDSIGPSLARRTVSPSQGKATRAPAAQAAQQSDPWTSPQTEDPPF